MDFGAPLLGSHRIEFGVDLHFAARGGIGGSLFGFKLSAAVVFQHACAAHLQAERFNVRGVLIDVRLIDLNRAVELVIARDRAAEGRRQPRKQLLFRVARLFQEITIGLRDLQIGRRKQGVVDQSNNRVLNRLDICLIRLQSGIVRFERRLCRRRFIDLTLVIFRGRAACGHLRERIQARRVVLRFLLAFFPLTIDLSHDECNRAARCGGDASGGTKRRDRTQGVADQPGGVCRLPLP